MQIITIIPVGGTIPEIIGETDFYIALNRVNSVNRVEGTITIKDRQYRLNTLNISGGGAGGYTSRMVLIPFDSGQTEFTLPQAPNPGIQTILTVGGQVQEDSVDYTISGTTLTWLNNTFQLNPTDRIVIYFS